MDKLLLYIATAAVLMLPSGVLAQTDTNTADDSKPAVVETTDQAADETVSDTQEEYVEEELPETHYNLPPSVRMYLGADVVNVIGSKRAAEYEWPYPSFVGGFKVHYTPLPHRLDVELDFHNKEDYLSEFFYAYRDIVKIDYIGMALWHNQDHFRPQAAAGAVFESNIGATYGVGVWDERLKFRLKWPDMAYHAFAEFRQYKREGTVLQRFVGRPLLAPNNSKLSRTRNIELTTRTYRIGANGHFGPIEAEYSHRIKDLVAHDDVTLIDRLRNGVPANGTHNILPESTENSDTLKLHTDLTGAVVASTTFVNGSRKSGHTGARLDYTRAGGEVVLIPAEQLTFMVRYCYNGTQANSPELINDPMLGLVTPIDPIDKRSNKAEASIKYTPFKGVNIKAEYIYENIHRENAKRWSADGLMFGGTGVINPYIFMPYDQNIHKVRLGFNTRPVKNATFRGVVEYMANGDPAYASEATRSFKGKFDAGYLLTPALNLGAHYKFTRANSSSADTSTITPAGVVLQLISPNMTQDKDNIGVTLQYNPVERFSCNAGYDWMSDRSRRNIKFAVTGVAFPMSRIPYSDNVHVYYAGAAYTFSIPLSLDVNYYQSFASGRYRTPNFVSGGSSTTGIGELTDMKIRETGGAVTAKYDLPKGWGASITYAINNYEDMADKPQDGEQDGTAHSILMLVSKKW